MAGCIVVAPHLFGLLFAEGGVPAVLGGSALLGWLLGLSYGRAQRMSRARFDRLPLLCYLCAVASLKGLVDGGVANYLMQTVFGVGMMLTWALLASAVPTLARARR